MPTQEEIEGIAQAIRDRGGTATAQEVAFAYLSVNQSDIAATAESRVTWEIWDHQSPINGMDADYYRSRDDFPTQGGEVYIIKVDGQVRYVQPHAPNAESMEEMSWNAAQAYAEQHAESLRAELRGDALINAIADNLQSATGVPAPTPPEDDGRLDSPARRQAERERRRAGLRPSAAEGAGE